MKSVCQWISPGWHRFVCPWIGMLIGWASAEIAVCVAMVLLYLI